MDIWISDDSLHTLQEYDELLCKVKPVLRGECIKYRQRCIVLKYARNIEV